MTIRGNKINLNGEYVINNVVINAKDNRQSK